MLENMKSLIHSGNEMLVVGLGKVNHQILHCWWHFWVALSSLNRAFLCEFHETRDDRFRRKNSTVFDNRAVFENASPTLSGVKALEVSGHFWVKRSSEFTYNNDIFADVNVRAYVCCRDDWVLADVDVITDVQREESDSFAELFEGWPDHRVFWNYAISPGSDVC